VVLEKPVSGREGFVFFAKKTKKTNPSLPKRLSKAVFKLRQNCKTIVRDV
jgi:hypothetical protein